MITTLSFTVEGNAKVVKSYAGKWMLAMGKVMGKDINGTTLILTKRNDFKGTSKQFHKQIINSMFPKKLI